MIRVANLTKTFGNLRAVDDLSFEINPGETLGLLGPNGAGKTTTISMILGATPPDAGAITIDNQTDHADARRRLGFAPQSISLYDELTAAENLRFFARLYGLSRAATAERTDWALEFAGLTDRAASRVATYSGGMKRRLNIAVALLHEPAAVLLDEPTVGVDPQSRNHIFESIEQLKDRGLTILYTTHYMEEAQRLCDRVAIMDKGRLLDLGAVDELIDRHGGDSIIEGELTDDPPDHLIDGATVNQRRFRLETHEPMQHFAQLADRGIRFRTLSVRRPDLERVFLALTGRNLRDD